jgi:hypothetical protein
MVLPGWWPKLGLHFLELHKNPYGSIRIPNIVLVDVRLIDINIVLDLLQVGYAGNMMDMGSSSQQLFTSDPQNGRREA